MRRRSSFLPALVALAAGTSALVAPVPGAAAATRAPTPATSVRTSTAVAATAPEEGAEPLQVTIDRLTPSSLPEKGKVRMSGTVTNTSDERWRAINVHAFISDVPLTSSAELAETATTPVDEYVGERITIPGTFDDIGALAPGQTTSFTVELRRDQIEASLPGVYWFGAHALGNTTEVRDTVADGRARTLLPLVPRETRGTEQAALVLPVRRAIRNTADGRLRAAGRWAADLSAGGRLRAVVDFGDAASTPLTWLVDPAVPDAVARLVAGNPPRTLADDPRQAEDPEEGQDQAGDDEEASPSAELVEPEPPTEVAPDIAAAPGAAWLTRFEDALSGDDVLALPYGDPDIAAIAAHAPEFYDRAVRRGGTQLDRWRVRTTPAVAPPEGYLPTAALSLLEGEETVLLSDLALPAEAVRGSGTVDDTPVLFSSSDVALGGPAPGDALSEVALRQRFVAEAAVRLLFHDRAPLVTVFPATWAPESPTVFWDGLDDVPWLEVTDLDELRPGRPVDPADIGYPVEQELTELDAENFTAAEELIEAGRTLDTVLPRNGVVAAQVLDEALTSLSYTERDRALESRRDTEAATTWISRRLGGVRLRAPRGVTLASNVGDFAPTVTNRLDHPVRVELRAVSLGDVEVAASAPLELAPGARQTVLLDAEATSPGVHYVRLMVTDEDGTPLGASQRVAIRSAEVSQVIWLILGVGVGMLFLAIAIRVVRRVRSERA